MIVCAMTSSELSARPGEAKRQARNGPVVITSRGRATHVLLTIAGYVALAGRDASIAELLAMPEAAEVAFSPPRLWAGAARAHPSTVDSEP